jgi:hypothetical protein
MSGYANVYAYDDVLYVEPMHRGEVGLINGPPYLRVAKGDSADAIGGTTREALDASTMPAPFSSPPFLRWSGARSWSPRSRRTDGLWNPCRRSASVCEVEAGAERLDALRSGRIPPSRTSPAAA